MQDVQPATAQHHDVPFQNMKISCESGRFRDAKNSSHGLNDIRKASLCALRLSVMSRRPVAAQCSCSNVFIAYRFQASGMDRVAGMVAECFSLHERLVFQCVSKNISLQLEEVLEREVRDSLEADSWVLLSSEWEQYCHEIQRNAFAFSEG